MWRVPVKKVPPSSPYSWNLLPFRIPSGKNSLDASVKCRSQS